MNTNTQSLDDMVTAWELDGTVTFENDLARAFFLESISAQLDKAYKVGRKAEARKQKRSAVARHNRRQNEKV